MHVLEYAFVGASDTVQMYLYVDEELCEDGLAKDGFATTLRNSNVQVPLRGHVLRDGRVLLCSGQFPIFRAGKSFREGLGLSQKQLDNAGEFLVFRKRQRSLQAMILERRDMYCMDETVMPCGYNYPLDEWYEVGRVLSSPHPLAALSRGWLDHFQKHLPECSFRYILDRRSFLGGNLQFLDLMVCLPGSAPSSIQYGDYKDSDSAAEESE